MESITTLLTSEAFLSKIPSVILLLIVVVILGKLLKVKIKTEHITIGGEKQDAYYERTIVRNQATAAHDFCASIESKIISTEGYVAVHDGFFVKYVLERVYDKVIDWITFNHIEATEGYIKCKQLEIRNLVYMLGPTEPFKTPEFQDRMDKWVEELIEQLISIRKLYSKEGK